jgi:lipopolysaccharide biosynthesis glycosyltransferase
MTAARDCICFACDEGYLPHFATALASLADNSPGHDVFLFGDALPENQIAVIHKLAEDLKIALTIIDTQTVSFAGLAQTEVYSRAAWIRVFVPHILPHAYRRMLYLDCDLVVLGALDELIGMDMEGKAAAAAENRPETSSIREKHVLQMPAEARYFNTGVFLVDLELWRQKQVSSQVLAYARANPDKLALVDQSAINAVCWADMKQIEGRYNYGFASAYETEPMVVHFYSKTKPWMFSDAPGFELYEHYRNKTPYKLLRPLQRKYAHPAVVKRKLYVTRFLQMIGLDKRAKIIDLRKWHERVERIHKARVQLQGLLSRRLAANGENG